MDVAALLDRFHRAGLKIATAESCTGGLLAAALTSVSGSSGIFDRGWVTYSNAAKTDNLDVPAALIAAKGAVSAEVAEAMASGALSKAKADVAVSVTGIAGPGGGSAEKPVGLVFIGLARRGKSARSERCQFAGEREIIRRQAVERALGLLAEAIG